MNRKMYLTPVGLALAVFGPMIFASPGFARKPNDGRSTNPVGAWFCEVSGLGHPFEALVTFHQNGTLTTSDTNDFTGLRSSLAGSAVTPLLQGVWKRTGSKRRIDFTLYGFQFFGTGDEPITGLLQQTNRARCQTSVDGDTQAGSCDYDVFFPVDLNGDGIPNSVNPITAVPDATFEDAFDFQCTRLQILPKE